ncbi:MAG: hypothetical protein QNJ72_20405 [Pleurocapsa sp. MO_226.B13]|nr:hypothetical protein [Pleurocapsa sp. MO_226.B13]
MGKTNKKPKYPANEKNWIFTGCDENIALGTLPECLSMAGVTSKAQYKKTYIDPLKSENLSESKKQSLRTNMCMERVEINDSLYQKLYRKALRLGKIEIDLDSSGWVSHEIEYNLLRANLLRENGY